MKQKMEHRLEKDEEIKEKLIKLNRCTKVVKGGRRFSFSALMAVGDKAGKVGLGFGKANEVPDAIKKAVSKAKKNMVQVQLKRQTIPHDVNGKFKCGHVWMKPARPGTGLIAGGPVRVLLELAGVQDILSKSRGSRNTSNLAKAALVALQSLKNFSDEAKKRGKSVMEMFN